jgi:hypothetical protein
MSGVFAMTCVQFGGHVFPKALGLTVRKPATTIVRDSDTDYDMIFDVSIQDGTVTVNCDVANYNREKHLDRLMVRAFDLATRRLIWPPSAWA